MATERRGEAAESASVALAIGVVALIVGALNVPFHDWLFPGSGEVHPFAAIGRAILLGLLLLAEVAAGIATIVLAVISLRRGRTRKGWLALTVGIVVVLLVVGFDAGIA